MRIVIHAEGGGEGQLLDTLFRQAWSAFFRSAGLAGRMPRVVRGQGRDQTIANYLKQLQQPETGVLPLLLVDSERAVRAGQSSADFLRADAHARLPQAADGQVFLMVQLMETWFLADRDLLRRYFGNELRENAFAAWPDLEAVPKETVLRALDHATAACRTRYGKGKVSFQMLGRLDPARVETACPHARALLEFLRAT